MECILELSSDSNDTIITSEENIAYSENFYNVEELGENDKASGEENASSSEDVDAFLKKLAAKYSILPKSDSQQSTEKVTSSSYTSRTKRKNPQKDEEQISTKKQKLDDEKDVRKKEKQTKKELMEKEKALKKQMRMIQKSHKPDELLKNIIVKIDEVIISEYGEAVTEKLKSNDITFKTVKQDCDRIISWSRKVQTIENLIAQVKVSDEKHYLLILPSSEFKFLTRSKSLEAHLHSLSDQLKFKQLTIAVFGIDKLNDSEEYAVMKVDLVFKCFWQFTKKIDDLATLIFMVTKSVAQIPYKLEKEEIYRNQPEYFAGSNKDTVRVDKDGNGLARLWRQMLTMFPLARLETAEAITSVYPSPSALFKAYDKCADESQKEKLLENLPITRANTPIATSSRRLGPELSKKVYKFFNSTENVHI